MMAGNDPLNRLSSAYRVEVNDDTRNRHLAEMGAVIRTAPPTPVPTGFALRSRLAGALAAVAVVVAPVGMAVAAEDSVPGDFLYPMKQVTERVRAFVDSDIGATHRVEEVERLMFDQASRAAVVRAVERAETATRELVDPTPLDSRLELARERLQRQEAEGAQPPSSSDLEGSEQQREGSPSGPPDEPDRQQGSSGQSEPGLPAPDSDRSNVGSGSGNPAEGSMPGSTQPSGDPSGGSDAGRSSETDPGRNDQPPNGGRPNAPDAGGAGGDAAVGERDGSGSTGA